MQLGCGELLRKTEVSYGRGSARSCRPPPWGRHPKYDDLIYPVNYGNIPEFKAPGDDFQDAYLLGIDIAVEPYLGAIIAIVVRRDDVESKFVVAPKGCAFKDEEILL